MNLVRSLKVVAKTSRSALKLSPMHKVFRQFKRRGINPKTLSALEVFGSDGQNHTRDIASNVANMEIWEIRPECEAILKQRFPNSEIKITDSYVEIARTPKKFDLVVVDNTDKIDTYHEHFSLFPNIFRVLSNPALIILNVIPKVSLAKGLERLNARQKFYNAIDPANITLGEIETTYRTLAVQNGWIIDWFFFERRRTFSLKQEPVYYAAFKLKHAQSDYH